MSSSQAALTRPATEAPAHQRWLTLCALAILVAGSAFIAAVAAGGRTAMVPAQHGGFPGWLRGPLPALPVRVTTVAVVALLLVMYAVYGAVVAWADAIDVRVLVGAIVVVTVVLALGPVLFSRDAFGYIGYARLGGLHGLNPYAHGIAARRHDPVFPWIGWRRSPSPYGPFFTAPSYLLARFDVATALWIWKAVVVAAALSCSAVLARAAQRRGLSAARAAALFGLNPVVTVFGVGGAHNDLLLVLLVASSVALAISGRAAAGGAAMVVAAAMKATTLVTLPFMALGVHPRRPLVLATLSAGAAAVVTGLLVFGTEVTGMLDALREQQQLVSTHSLPNMLGWVLGFGGITPGLRIAATVASALAVAALLVWTARGGDWIEASGWATLALFAGSAWLMTWYAIWALPFAALARRRSLAISAVGFGALLIALRW